MVMLGVRHARQPEVADLEFARGVQQQVARLQVAVQHVGRVDVSKIFLVETLKYFFKLDFLRLF